jgi:hypothetical protein
MTAIPYDQFRRIAERANDPRRRTYLAGVEADAQPLDFQPLIGDLQRHGAPGAQGLLGAFGKLTELTGGLGKGVTMMGPGGAYRLGGEPIGPQPLAAPPSEAAIAAAEAQTGRSFPEDLKQLYAIGDGGFGPGGGLFPLYELVKRYRELTGEPFGPAGQDWPAKLLPLFDEDPVLLCLDLESGAVVAWDPEEIEDEDSDEDWRRSFKPEHASLADAMADWLEQPGFGE